MGRPRKPVPRDARVQIERLAATGASQAEIASALGVGRDLLRQWVSENEDLALALTRGRELERQALHGRLFKAAMAGNVVAAFFLLKCRHEGYDDRGRDKETTSAEEHARKIREALAAMDATIGRVPTGSKGNAGN